MNELINFEGQEVSIKTDKGITLINLVNTAKVCGLIRKRGNNELIRWDDVTKKLETICSSAESSTPQNVEEIKYILDEIENIDDRNSIYMSSWLTRRLAMECHSDKAMEYKNFLATLDEKRSNNQLSIPNQNIELATMVSQVMQNVIPTLTTEIAKQFIPIINETKQQVNHMAELIHNQSIIYDNERDELKEMIGLRAKNTMLLTEKLKEKLSSFYGEEINANDNVYKKVKNIVFKEFKVAKWEEIPVGTYNKVYAFIDNIEDELIKL